MSGKQRNGKTLYMVQKIRDMAAKLKSDQMIYVHGFPDLKIEGTACMLNYKEWHLLPRGSIMVFDEAWELFPRLSSAATLPDHYTAFATLGHRGHIAYLVTQDPGQLHKDVRYLIGTHTHVERLSGAEAATLFYWQGKCVVDPDSKRNRQSSHATYWAYPKDCYALYKSSEEHTVKFELPSLVKQKLGVIVFSALIIALGIGYVIHSVKRVKSDGQAQEQVAEVKPATDAPSRPAGTSAIAPGATPGATELSYFDARIPRITGLPHTAPAYDGITAPTQAPKPAACIQGAGKTSSCSCYTQQGTKMVGMPQDLCRSIVENGWFDESAPLNGPIQANGPVQAPVPASRG